MTCGMHPNSNSLSKNRYRCGGVRGGVEDGYCQGVWEWEIHSHQSLRCKEGRFLAREQGAIRLPFRAVLVLSHPLLQAQALEIQRRND